jgi:hypothetical protein
MPTFTPPVVYDWPQILDYDPQKRSNPIGYRLMRYFPARGRGVNVFKMSDGTYPRDDQTPGEPYPATDQPVEGVINVSWYEGVATVQPLPNPWVVKVYYGGHSHLVDDAEAARLTAAGYGANIT